MKKFHSWISLAVFPVLHSHTRLAAITPDSAEQKVPRNNAARKHFPLIQGVWGARWHKHVSKLLSLSVGERGQVSSLRRPQRNRWGWGRNETDGASPLALCSPRSPSHLRILGRKLLLLLSPYGHIPSRPLPPPHPHGTQNTHPNPAPSLNACLRDKSRSICGKRKKVNGSEIKIVPKEFTESAWSSNQRFSSWLRCPLSHNQPYQSLSKLLVFLP